jgi:hypothetical protein
MHVLAIGCFTGAFLVAAFALIYQRRDIVAGHGGTMGGEMTAGLMWVIASFLSAIGSYTFIPWYFSILVFFAVLAFSFLIRMAVARIPKKPA